MRFGIVPEIAGSKAAREVELGLVDPAVLDGDTLFCEPDPRKACGASPGLTVPYLRGGETLILEHLSSKSSKVELRLPAAPARLRVDGRKGKMLDVEPVLSTVLIEPDAEHVTLVWRGTGHAIRPYSDEELAAHQAFTSRAPSSAAPSLTRSDRAATRPPTTEPRRPAHIRVQPPHSPGHCRSTR